VTVQPLSKVRTAADVLADPAALIAESAAYGAALGTDRLPVASALYFKGWTWAPIELAVGRWLNEQRVVDLSAHRISLTLRMASDSDGPVDDELDISIEVLDEHLIVLPDDPLAGRPGVTVVADEASLLAALGATLVDGLLAPAVEAFAHIRRGGRRPLWGTVAQSLCYPAAYVDSSLVPDRQARIAQLLTILPAHAAALVEQAETDEGDGWRPMLLRRTCCFAYTLPGCSECTTCCMLSDAQRSELVARQGAVWRRPALA
jgi:hypothetical protein